MAKKNVFNRTTYIHVLAVCSIFYLLAFGTWLVLVSINNGLHMNTFAADGTFQLYNPLRRISLGQDIGHDFPFFHGIGLPLLHYPLFSVLGGGVFGAEVAKWLISPLLFLASSFILYYAFFRNLRKAVIALGLVTYISLNWVDVIWPGNSLMGARGTLPVIVAAALIWQTSRELHIYRYSIAINRAIALCILGLSPLFGTEQGVSAILAFAISSIILLLREEKNNWLKKILSLALEGCVVIIFALIGYTILSKGHPLNVIRYAFFDVPQDQGWYFGSDITGYLTWGNLLPRLFDYSLRYIWISIIAGGYTMFRLLRNRRLKLKPAVLYGFFYGLTAFMITIPGYYSPGTQLIPIQRVCVLFFTLWAMLKLFENLENVSKKTRSLSHQCSYLAIYALILVLTAGAFTKFTSARNDFAALETIKLARQAIDRDDYFVASSGWKQSIDAFRPYIKPGDKIWSFYTGIYETTLGGNQIGHSSGGEDYIIHALGKQRRANYEKEFIASRSRYVISLKPSYFDFEEWLWHSHWKIYKHLTTNYKIVAENASGYLWEYSPQNKSASGTKNTAKIYANSFTLPESHSKKTVVYDVNITYKTKVISPLAKRLPRYIISIESKYKGQTLTVSLPGDQNNWTFPVISLPGEDIIVLKAHPEGIVPFTELTLQSADYQKTNVPDGDLRMFENNACFAYKNHAPKSAPWSCSGANYELRTR